MWEEDWVAAIAVAIWSQDTLKSLMVDHHVPKVLHVLDPCDFLHRTDHMISGPSPAWKSSALLRNRKTCSATWIRSDSPQSEPMDISSCEIAQPPAGGSARCLEKRRIWGWFGMIYGWIKEKHVGTWWNNGFLQLTQLVLLFPVDLHSKFSLSAGIWHLSPSANNSRQSTSGKSYANPEVLTL